MFVVKAVIQGVGETLFLRYNLMGDANAAYDKLVLRQRWHEADEVERPVSEEFADDFGVRAYVPASGIIFVSMLGVDKYSEGDAKARVRGEVALQREITKHQPSSAILPPGSPNGMPFRA